MKLALFKPSSCAAASLRIGIIIVLTIVGAILAYRTEAVIRLLLGHGIWLAYLASLVFFAYIWCIIIASVVGVVLSIVSLARREGRHAVAVSGLALNISVPLLFGIMFFGQTSLGLF